MAIYPSPLRYPGGKKNLTEYFTEIIKANKFSECVYVEPYAGGAGAAINLLFLEYVERIVINDADYNIYCFWNAILSNTEKFIYKIKKIKVNLEEWKKQKKILTNNKKYSKLEVGFATFFLNRCNHSGIISGGPIGGYKQLGKWKINARFNKIDLIERINKIAFYNERIKVYNLDAIEFMQNICLNLDYTALFFLDPPYYEKGNELYLNYYTHEDHKILSQYLHKCKENWILTYDNIPQVISLYNNKRHFTYNLNYSVNNYKKSNEVMFFSDNLIIPNRNIT